MNNLRDKNVDVELLGDASLIEFGEMDNGNGG